MGQSDTDKQRCMGMAHLSAQLLSSVHRRESSFM